MRKINNSFRTEIIRIYNYICYLVGYKILDRSTTMSCVTHACMHPFFSAMVPCATVCYQAMRVGLCGASGAAAFAVWGCRC